MRLASGSAQNNAFSHGLADFDEHGTGCRGCACSAFSSTICMILSKSIRTSRPQLCSENVFSLSPAKLFSVQHFTGTSEKFDGLARVVRFL